MYSPCNFGHALSVGAIRFEDRFCASKKGGIGGGGWVSAWGAVHMAAALASCRKALVSTGLAIYLLFDTNGRTLSPRALTIVSLLMSGRGRGNEP